VLQYYVIERFLYRLSQSRYRHKFLLKGALIFLAWGMTQYRPTRDIDLLGYTSNDIGKLVGIIQEICSLPVPEDGLIFEPQSVQGERITEDADYEGVRVRFQAHVGSSRLHLQIDVGFADVVSPEPQSLNYPTLLSMPAPELRGYPPESVVAEKLQAMVFLGTINSRMKDFYDLWMLAAL
jgi:predicted nucleotidyltransferase component of viral defense system